MKLECRCGLRNRPYAEKCGACGKVLQTPQEAARRKREWDSFTPELRASLEADFNSRETAHRTAFGGRKVRLVVLALVLGAAFPALMHFIPPRCNEATMLAVPAGLLAALVYHLSGPGPGKGLVLFALAYLAPTAAKLVFLPTAQGMQMSQWMFPGLITLIVAMAGWAIGYGDSRKQRL